MARVALPKMRSLVKETPRGVRVTMPAPRSIFSLLFLPLWLVAWAFGEVSVILFLAKGIEGELGFVLVWLILWTLGGGFTLLTLLRMLAGKERLELEGDVMRHRYEIFGIGWSREYELRHVQNLRVASPGGGMPTAWLGFGEGGGLIAFDYGAKTIRAGDGLDEAEARQIIARLQQRHRFAPTAV